MNAHFPFKFYWVNKNDALVQQIILYANVQVKISLKFIFTLIHYLPLCLFLCMCCSRSCSRMFSVLTRSLMANRIILRTLKTTVLYARLLGRLTMPFTALTCMASVDMACHRIKPLQCKSMQCLHHIHRCTHIHNFARKTYIRLASVKMRTSLRCVFMCGVVCVCSDIWWLLNQGHN